MELPQRYVIRTDQNGELAPDSRQDLRENMLSLPCDGQFLVTVEEFKQKKFTATRYKYYFDCVLGLAFAKVRERFAFVDNNAEMRHPKNVDELHYCLKLIYNPVKIIDSKGGQARVIGATTTDLSDSEFIGEYMEEIISDFSMAPYYAYGDTGCPTIQEYREMHKEKTWSKFKGEFHNQTT